MKIFLFGASGTGKSTIAEVLAEKTGFKVVAIDKFRDREQRNGKGEEKAKADFLQAIQEEADMIVEASGFGRLGDMLRIVAAEGGEHVFVLLQCTESIRLNRLKTRSKYHFRKSRQPPTAGITQVKSFYSRYGLLELNNNHLGDIQKNLKRILEHGKIQPRRTD